MAAAGLAVWKRDTVVPYVLSKVQNSDSLSDRLDQQREENKQLLTDMGVEVPGLTREMMEALLKGWTNPDYATRDLHLDDYQSEDSESDLVNRCVAELYQYESRLYGQLGELRQSVIADWKSRPKSERTFAAKQKVKSEAASQCYAMEVEADNQVTAILDRYRDKVAQQGGDSSRIDALWSIYCSEKASVKAYYLSLD